MAMTFFLETLRKLITKENERWIRVFYHTNCFLSYLILIIFTSFLLFHTFFLPHSFFPPVTCVQLKHFSFTVESIDVAYSFLWPSELKKLLHLPSFVLSIEYSTIRSAESFLNLALLLSRLIHKFSLFGLARFIVGHQKFSSDVHDGSWKL